MAAVDATPPAYERIDLHTHSRHSDGSLSPTELVALAAQRQVQLLALTDHDTLAGCAEAARACAERQHRISLRQRTHRAVARARDPHRGPAPRSGLRGSEGSPARRAAAAHRAGARDRRQTDPRRAGGRGHGRGSARAAGHAHAAAPRARCWWRGVTPATWTMPSSAGWAPASAPRVPAQWPGIELAIGAIQAAGGLAVLAHPHRYKLSAGALRSCAASSARRAEPGLK